MTKRLKGRSGHQIVQAGNNAFSLRSRTIQIDGPIDDDMAQMVYETTAALLNLDPEGNILFRINTDGGEYEAMMSIVDTIRAARELVTVATFVHGRAYSAGAVILACGDVGNRIAAPQSLAMIHDIQSIIVGGLSQDIAPQIEDLQQKSEITKELLIHEIGKEYVNEEYRGPSRRQRKIIEKDLDEIYSNRDKDMYAEDMLELGLVDSIAFFMPRFHHDSEEELVELEELLELVEEDLEEEEEEDLEEEEEEEYEDE